MKNEQEMCSTLEHENRAADSNEESRAEPAAEARRPATRRERKILERLHTERGAAFEVYLDCVWRGTPIDEMEADFENLYWASYENVAQFAIDGIEAHDWKEPIDDAIRQHAIPRHLITWNTDAFIDMVRSDFEFHHRDGEVHVFIR